MPYRSNSLEWFYLLQFLFIYIEYVECIKPVHTDVNSFWSLKWSNRELSESCSAVFDSLRPHGLYSPWNSPGRNTGVGSLSLLQEIFLTQGSSPGLPRCRWILYQLSHKGSPRILEWVAYPFSSGSSQPRNRTRVSCIAGRFFTPRIKRELNKNKTKSEGTILRRWSVSDLKW